VSRHRARGSRHGGGVRWVVKRTLKRRPGTTFFAAQTHRVQAVQVSFFLGPKKPAWLLRWSKRSKWTKHFQRFLEKRGLSVLFPKICQVTKNAWSTWTAWTKPINMRVSCGPSICGSLDRLDRLALVLIFLDRVFPGDRLRNVMIVSFTACG
jgi:hypothetical protein